MRKTAVVVIEDVAAGDYPLKMFLRGDSDPWPAPPTAQWTVPRHPSPFVDAQGTQHDLAAIVARVSTQRNASPVFHAIGTYLLTLLTTNDLQDDWRALRDRYMADETSPDRLRIVLDVRPEPLRALPWEFIADRNRRLSVNPLHTTMRGPVDFASTVEPAKWPIRALVVVGVQRDDQTIGWQEELEAVEDAFDGLRQIVDYEVLVNPSATTLRSTWNLLKPHVFHFIGHGRVVAAGRVALNVWDGAEFWDWTPDEIGNELIAQAPRLAYLNACRSTAPGRSTDIWSVAEAFRAAGTQAVIAVQGDIRGSVAAACAGAFYKALAAGEPLDVAMAHARRESFQVGGLDTRDWALPALSVSLPPEKVLNLTTRLSNQQRAAVATEFAEILAFVDRKQERRELWDVVDRGANPHLMLVQGDERLGKTDLIFWCLEACALRGRKVRYVDFRSHRGRDFVEVLRMIRGSAVSAGPAQGSMIRAPLDPRAFDRFHFELNHLLKGTEPPELEGAGPGPTDDLGLELRPGPENLVERVFAAFQSALQTAAAGEPLVLALDHVEDGSLDQSFATLIVPYLIRPLATGALAPVRVIIAVRSSRVADLGLDTVEARAQVVRLGRLAIDEFAPLAKRYCRRLKLDNVVPFIPTYANQLRQRQGTWTPSELKNLRDLSGLVP